ncbi:peptidoglycan D,D-transpeptidase FtsI family protein [Futiania mangrovi]|uniref:Penicillin-binding protein 2 n=1 Tax=Futiania mangrovi TaxID=2959716 RepID=A0A9J6PBL1_9PROT|nr:penicillin-binding protein 2 [Futiania mangrovii]MCP1334947.1 penicillin-binding protein 2 [Futiania mangrovii]
MTDVTYAKPRPHAPARTRRVLRLDGEQRAAMETGRNRMALAAVVFAAAFGVLGMRLVDLGVLRDAGEPVAAAMTSQLSAGRADIVDRNGVLLATELPTASLFADARRVLDPADAARRLVRVLPELDEAQVLGRLDSRKAFVWIARALTPRQQEAVLNLGIPGLDFVREERRVYPQGRAAPHIVGFVDVDNRGIAGMEKAFEQALTDPERAGKPLALSIDLRVQHILRDALAAQMSKHQAIGATGLVMDVRTGELLAMVSLPDFDPNQPAQFEPERLFNRATLGVYEMGSTFKIFNTAMALDSGAVRVNDSFDASKPIKIGRFTINDYHGKHRWLSVPEVFKYSSNIGSARMALAVGAETQRAYLRDLGLLEAAVLEVPEVGKPLVPSPWREVNTLTVSYGHGLAVTPVQLAGAVAAVVNGGRKVVPTLLRQDHATPGEQVISARTSALMRDLMRLAVLDGTGRNADVPGYPVIGKTGTAEKANAGGYARKALLSSFVGAFPAHDPRFLVLAVIDEPKPTPDTHGYATGGWVAAPAVREVVARLGPLYGLRPSLPQEGPNPDVRVASFTVND